MTRPPSVTLPGGVCAVTRAAWPKGWGMRRRQLWPNRRVPSHSDETFGEARHLQSSVLLRGLKTCAAAPLKWVVSSGLFLYHFI